MSRFLTAAFLGCLAVGLPAHPGHGPDGGHSPLHHLVSVEHALVLVVLAAIGAIAAWRLRRAHRVDR